MKRNSKNKAAKPAVATSASDAIVSIVASDNTDLTIGADEVEKVESEIMEDDLAVADMESEGNGGAIITVEAIDVTDDTAAIDALLESAEVSPVEQLEGAEVEELIAAAEADAIAAKAAAAPSTPKTPKAPKTVKVAAPVVPVRNFSDVAAMDKAALTAQLVAPTTAKKIIEKAENLIAAVESGKKLSRYTSIAVKALVASGSVSGKSLTDTFTGAGLGLGTARSQAQQMTSLFKLAGLTTAVAGSKDLVMADTNLAKELAAMSV